MNLCSLHFDLAIGTSQRISSKMATWPRKVRDERADAARSPLQLIRALRRISMDLRGVNAIYTMTTIASLLVQSAYVQPRKGARRC